MIIISESIIAENMIKALREHHQIREEETFIYVKRKNIDKHSRTDRTFFYDCYPVSEIERFLRRTDINTCDFWMTAAEYKWGFYRLKETTIIRTKPNGEHYVEIRRQLPNREKWVEAIQLNFLHLNLRKSELGYIPTIEEAVELIYARCRELNIPMPTIVDTGDNGETLELRWPWLNAMKNCGERDDYSIRYPIFNKKFDEMQVELLHSFLYLGADERQIKVTSMLCVVGTPNTKTGNLRRVVVEANEILTYQDFAKRLGLNFDEVKEVKVAHEEHHVQYEERVCKIERSEQQQPKHEKLDEIPKRSQSEIMATLGRALEIINPVSPIANFASELAQYTDFEVVMTKKNSQSQQELSTQEEFVFDEALNDREPKNEPKIEAEEIKEEIKAPQVHENKPCQTSESVEKFSRDLLRLHHDSNYWVCLCTENKVSKGQRGLWREYWIQSGRVLDALSTLKVKLPDFDEFNIYVSQLEFSERTRKVEKVAAFRACFVDIDGKIAGGDLTAEEWKNLILKYCREKKIPTPSEMVFSGNGVHVKYFFTRLMTAKEFSRWERLERKLAEIFKEIGADSHATDGARVLRVEGTKNCKPDTKDREVRVIFTGDDYDFEKFAQEIETMLPDEIKISEPVCSSKPEVSKTQLKKSEKQTSEQRPESSKPDKSNNKKSESSETTRQPSDEEQALSTFEDWQESLKTWFYVFNATTDSAEWVSRADLNNYLNKQDKAHKLQCSIVEYTGKQRQDRAKLIENIFFSHVVLMKRPGESLEGQIAKIMEHCRQYRGVGILEPNRILENGNKLILIWRYSKEASGQELPGRALSRWKAAQECLTHYFEDLGAVNFSSALKSTMLMPLSGFASVKVAYENPGLKYLFDTVASAVLPFSQREVKSYKAEKKSRPRRSIVLEELTAEYLSRREAEGRKSKFGPALKIFNDIVRLLRLRALNGVNDEVPEGRRELSVFYALNFAVQAGLVKEGTENFNELAQKLIDFCGKSFTLDCTPDTMTTLRNKFADGKEVYRPKKKTLIDRLEITAEEQAELDILKEDAPKSPKRKKIPAWEILGVSRATYYRREKKSKETAKKLREFYVQYLIMLWILNKAAQELALIRVRHEVRLQNSHIMIGEWSQCSGEGETCRFLRDGVSVCGVSWGVIVLRVLCETLKLAYYDRGVVAVGCVRVCMCRDWRVMGCEIGRMWQWLMVVVYRVVVVVDLCRLGRPPPWVIEGVIRDFGFLGIYWVILGLGRSLGGVVEGFLGVVGG